MSFFECGNILFSMCFLDFLFFLSIVLILVIFSQKLAIIIYECELFSFVIVDRRGAGTIIYSIFSICSHSYLCRKKRTEIDCFNALLSRKLIILSLRLSQHLWALLFPIPTSSLYLLMCRVLRGSFIYMCVRVCLLLLLRRIASLSFFFSFSFSLQS